jgi:hypothetical protein
MITSWLYTCTFTTRFLFITSFVTLTETIIYGSTLRGGITIYGEMCPSTESGPHLYIAIESCQSYKTMRRDVTSLLHMIDGSLLQCTNNVSRFIRNGSKTL